MNTTFKHSFQFKANQDLVKLFEGVNKFSTLVKNIEKLSTKNPDRYDPNDYKGDAFEFFVEVFLKAFQFDNRITLREYEPNMGMDNGVDGFGLNWLGEKSAVQIKYRSNTSHLLTHTEDGIGNLIHDGLHEGIMYGNEKKGERRHYIFTTAKGLHYYTENENFRNKVECFGYEHFKFVLDKNDQFWNWCRSIAKELTKKK